METKEVNVTFAKNGKGNISPKINLSKKWLDELNITIDDRQVLISFDGNQIIIKKKLLE